MVLHVRTWCYMFELGVTWHMVIHSDAWYMTHERLSMMIAVGWLVLQAGSDGVVHGPGGEEGVRSEETEEQGAGETLTTWPPGPPGPLATWPPGHLATYGHMTNWPPGHLTTWPTGHLAIWPSDHLASWPPGPLATWLWQGQEKKEEIWVYMQRSKEEQLSCRN